MALTTAQIQNAYVAFFNRPADVAGLTYWSTYAGSTADLLNTFAQSTEYKNLYSGLNNTQIVNAVYQNLFGHTPDVAGLTYWVTQLDNGKLAIGNIADAINKGAQGTDATIIANKTSAATEFTKALDTTAEIVAYAGVNSTGLAAVKAWLNAVTSDAATLTNATSATTLTSITTTVLNNVASNGSTFTLTKEVQVLTGSSGSDTFVATNDAAGNSPSLNSGDQLDGGDGTDTLQVTSLSNDTPVVTLKNVEKVQVQQLTANSGNISAANWTGVTEIANVNSTKNLTVIDVGANAKISVTNGVAGNSTNVTFTNSKLGATAAISLAVDATGTKAGAHTVTATTGGTDVVTTLSVDATGANFVKYDGAADDKITALNVTGSGTLTLTQNDNELRKVATVDASKNTGGLTVTLSGVTATTLAVTGGSGKDAITANAATIETIDLGAGDDTLTLAAVGNVTAADSYKGGDGTDTLSLASVADASTLITNKFNGQFTGFERLTLGTASADLDVSKFGVNYVTVSGDNGGGATKTLSGFTSGATLALARDGNHTDQISVGMTGATDAGTPNDTLNIVMNADLTGNATYKVGVDGINILNVSADDQDAVTSTGIYTLTLGSANNVREVNISGKAAVTMTSAGWSGTEGVKLVSTGSGDLTFTGTGLGDVITGGSGKNVITGGNGKDTIDLSASAAKQDSIVLTGIKAAANADTIKGFVAGAAATTGDTVTVAAADTKDSTGAGAADFLNATTAATVVNANQAVTQFNVTASKDVIELGNAALGSNGTLSAATDGTELLKALATSGTATGITAETAGGGDTVYFVAYQGGNAYLYYGNDAGGTNGLIEANEITLVATFTGVAAGAFAAGDFILV
ncbi:DUF4214 domain-containing protein [Rivihabitans pingtungensis]|uniref:DUF4214 domain-containing protein n=1 Tax=Rivihabitans pingtungensis TaxID=1054498 RepID=UPI002352A40C|nr:DUF4214 domain-containing protein [Rivihabitans pingtungensis]MCK6436698.1 DUF4214 domain-containing protein [Rivihabitans pingtungensis]